MRITAQPFGMKLKDERAGKWLGPKIFADMDTMWAYLKGWYLECLEYDFWDRDEWVSISAEEAVELAAEGKRYCNLTPHIGDDLYDILWMPQKGGFLVVKDADRIGANG